MIEEIASVCHSPCCFAPITTVVLERTGDILWQGTLKCTACGRSFPLQDGIAYLTLLDATWSYILKELVNRRKIVQEELEGAEREKTTAALKKSQDEIVTNVMEALFEEALKEIPLELRPRILDVGAGLCQTSTLFAERGAQVVATETEIANLQYISFEQTDPPKPEAIEIRGKVYYRKNPRRSKRYFSRFLCNAERLPFESGVFDVVFCRSVLHHVQDMRRSLQEMVRVTRPGGRILLCSEPIRSVLDREEKHLDESVDKREGMNERRPTLAQYLLPLLRQTQNITIQYWQSPFIDRSRTFFKLLRYDYMKHLRQGERVSGLRIVKLLPVNASVNLLAEKKRKTPPPPRWLHRAAGKIDVAKLLNLYTYKDLEEERRDFSKKTGLLLALRRDLLTLRDDVGTVFMPARCPFVNLEKGWLGKARRAGRCGRFTHKVADAILRRRANEKTLLLSIAAPQPGTEHKATIRVNAAELTTIATSSRTPQTFTFDVAHVHGDILHVEIENHSAPSNSLAQKQKEPLHGIWVHSIKIV
jgi:SAM-dependent methyltransferase